jgi:hypothetical protein
VVFIMAFFSDFLFSGGVMLYLPGAHGGIFGLLMIPEPVPRTTGQKPPPLPNCFANDGRALM